MIQILATAYMDNIYFKRAIDEEKANSIILFSKKYAIDGISGELYCDRGQILTKIFSEYNFVVYCEDNIGTIINKGHERNTEPAKKKKFMKISTRAVII